MKKVEWLLLGFLIGLFLFVRLFRFNETFHFYYDQPLFSIEALKIWRSGDIPLIGPPISFNWEGRQVFQGGIIYLTQLLFLLIGGFDPMRSTLAFIIFASLMMIPLWIGVKKLSGVGVATVAGLFYALFPPMINGTLELTNPYYQLALTPILIWSISQYEQKRDWRWAMILGLTMGVLLQFHYQFVVVIVAVLLYLIAKKSRVSLVHLVALGAGGVIGFSPLVIFELRNNFYNLQTFKLYLSHWGEFSRQMGRGFPIQYFLSLMLLVTSLLVSKIKLPKMIIAIVVVLLFFVAFRDFVVTPKQGGILKDWKYQDELTVNKIIKNENLSNYNIAMWYDTRSITQRYLLMRENRDFDFENYRYNQYLFVVYPNDNWQSDSAYELNTFKPSKLRKQWKINDKYNLYLAERVSGTD